MKQSAAVLLCRLHPERASERAFTPSPDQPSEQKAVPPKPYQGTVSQCREWGRSAFEGQKLLERLRQLTSVSGQTNQSCKLVSHSRANIPLQSGPCPWCGKGRIKFLCRALFDVAPRSPPITSGDSPHSQERLNKTKAWDINALSPDLGGTRCSPAVLQWLLQIYYN